MNYLINLKYYLEFKFDILLGYIDNTGKPKKCRNCGSYELENDSEFFTDYILCEYSYKCNNCNKIMGYWAYGYWQR